MRHYKVDTVLKIYVTFHESPDLCEVFILLFFSEQTKRRNKMFFNQYVKVMKDLRFKKFLIKSRIIKFIVYKLIKGLRRKGCRILQNSSYFFLDLLNSNENGTLTFVEKNVLGRLYTEYTGQWAVLLDSTY